MRNRPLYFLFVLSATLGNEVFYISFLPFIHWNLDPFLCRRLVNMWAVRDSTNFTNKIYTINYIILYEQYRTGDYYCLSLGGHVYRTGDEGYAEAPSSHIAPGGETGAAYWVRHAFNSRHGCHSHRLHVAAECTGETEGLYTHTRTHTDNSWKGICSIYWNLFLVWLTELWGCLHPEENNAMPPLIMTK